MDEEETAEEQRLKAVPEYLWKVAEYVEQAGKWQGTATELLSAVGISEVKPNQFTRKMAEYANELFTPRGIKYKYTRTEQKRLVEFCHDDDDGVDGADDDIDITQLSGWDISKTPSSSSSSAFGKPWSRKYGA